jgi:hypothetical protein
VIPVKVLNKDQRVNVPDNGYYCGVLTPREIAISQDFGVENRTRFTLFVADREGNLFSISIGREQLLGSLEAVGIRLT